MGSLLIEFQKKLVSRIREIREAQKISQQDLAKLARVSRQTIYYLERGQSNPSTLLSIKIAKILNKKVEDIFYDEPVIRDFLRNKTLGELDEVSELTEIDVNRITTLRKIGDTRLEKEFSKDELINIANALGLSFEELFLEI